MHHLLELFAWLLMALVIGWFVGRFLHCVLLRGGRPRDGYVENMSASSALAGGAVALTGGAAAATGATSTHADANATGATTDASKISPKAEADDMAEDARDEQNLDARAAANVPVADSDTTEAADDQDLDKTEKVQEETSTPSTPDEEPADADAAAASADTTAAGMPVLGLSGPVGGKADDLQMISGIGPKLEKMLHDSGIYHFAQIAAWTKKDIEEVDSKLKFKGRIEREEWVRQAKLLAAGKMEQFEKEYGTGGKKGADGKKHAGSRTRRKK